MRRRTRHGWFVALLAALGLAPCALAGSVVQTEQVRAELVAHAPHGLAPGKTVWLGLALEHIPHWHTYWKNAGDSGLPTTMNWQLPAGAAAGDIDWPTPSRLPLGPLLNFGYEHKILLPVPLTISAPIDSTSFKVRLAADWLVCKVECIPQSGDFELDLPVGGATIAHAADFERALAARPRTVPGAEARAQTTGGALAFEFRNLPASLHGRTAQLFPEIAGVVDNPAVVSQEWRGDVLHARWPISAQQSASPAELPMVLAFADDSSVRVVTRIGAWSAAAAAPVAGSAELTPDNAPTTAPAPGFLLALLFAFIGGVLLNLMPCVFPVLSLKVYSLAQQDESPRTRMSGALAYTAGVVLSFLALAALLIVARAGGEELGWGFQLQSPLTVVALATLFTLIGLNLAGVFEVGSLLPSNIASLRARDATLDSFLTGVLAAAVASPCTAPFMGAALGVALTWPAAQSLLVFAMLGLGVAAPYLLVAAFPGIGRLLPRSGRWMQTFRTFLAFPMFATVVWLVWVLGVQVGVDGAAALLAVLVTLAFATWWWSHRPASGAARLLASLAALALAATAFAFAAPQWRVTMPSAASTAAVGGIWQPWSPQRVAELRAAGRTVFVDFTAAWCVTCQYNKRTTFADADVLAAFEANNVALLRADWTSRDATIGAELRKLGRSGVPVYVVYAGADPPRLLSELPSEDEVLSAVVDSYPQ